MGIYKETKVFVFFLTNCETFQSSQHLILYLVIMNEDGALLPYGNHIFLIKIYAKFLDIKIFVLILYLLVLKLPDLN